MCAIALVGGALIAGCGGGGSSTTSTSSTPSTSTTTTAAAKTTASSTTTKSASKTSGSALTSPQIATAVALCKSEISAAATLTSAEKSQLQSLCQKAASGDVSGARSAAEQVCKDIIKNSGLSGSEATTAENACNSVGKGGSTGATTPTIPSGGGGVSAAELQAGCQSITQIESVLPSSLKGTITDVCKKIANGDISGAKSELKQVCQSIVKLVPQSEQAIVAASCSKL